MKRPRLLKVYAFVRNFMFSSVNKEFLIFLFFLALSGGFWLLAALNETYEKEFLLPVRLANVPKNVVITSNEDDVVRVTLRDKGFTMMAYLYSQQLRPVLLNYSNYANKKTGRGIIPTAEIQKQLYTQLYGSTKIVSVKPDRVEFSFNYGESKRVPIRMAGVVSPGERRYLSDLKFMPSFVTIYANRRLLDSIKAVYTEDLHIVNFSDTISRLVSLRRIEGVKVIPNKVKLMLYPDVLTEESIEVPVMAIHLPADKVLRTFPSRVKVHFTIGVSSVRSIRSDAFSVVADYAELAAHPSEKCTLYLKTIPQGARNARLEIEQVDYLIEQK